MTSTEVAVPVITTDDEALVAAHDLADQWRISGPRRDRDRAVPREELAQLGRSGLLGIMVPRRLGGAEARAGTLTRVFAILAAADAALAQVPQNHFGGVFGLLIEPDNERAEYLLRETLRGARFGNAGHERGKGSRGAPRTTIVDDPAGYRINGSKSFCTGALTADWVPVSASHPDGWVATAFVPQGTPGLLIHEDWDAFGQRATVSGSATLTDVRVAAEHVFSSKGRPKAATAFRYARSQLTHAAIQLGIAREIHAFAGRLGRSSPRFRAWHDGLVLDIRATEVLIDRAAALIDEIATAGHGTPEAVLAVGIAVDEAKCLAYDLGPFAADGLLPFVEAGQLADADGFDRYWRNARTHSLHDPVRWRRHYVGDHHLNGTPPPFMKWLLEENGDAPL